jgi:hypothetical protein
MFGHGKLDLYIVVKNIVFLPNFLFLVMAAILVGRGDCRTQFGKGTTQGPFHQRLVQIGPVVLEDLINM